ncbi:putative oxidoreductase [Paractinoplanes rishiriensis]|uniref:Oxidoreductase n=2 Tax=Paractinoplanes rishiriensis TaxID=1050105 RepID=A0A919K919_9ACTN|nr:putative oxidoreductase [Actinoplanes rishiriensis]
MAPLTSLLEPVTIAGLPLRGRFAMAPMTRYHSPGGVPTAEVAAYYRRRAEGGVGLIITEGILVDHPSAGHETDVPRLTRGPAEQGWRLVTSEVHAAGGRIAAQLWHQGSERGRDAWTPMSMKGKDFEILLNAYAGGARTAVRAGFDAIEIHAAHGYLLDEFLWPLSNRRTDRYGGTVRNRAAFPAEVIRAVRHEMPAGMPLVVRFSQFKERDFGARIADTPAELATVLDSFVTAGADVLHASQRRFWEPAFDGDRRNLAGWAKHLTGLPTITVGSVGLHHDPARLAELAARREDGEFDLVALGRILLGNPGWVRLAASGRFGEIRDYRKSDEETYF